MDDVKAELEEAPAADVLDIKVGEWIACGLELMEKYTTLIRGEQDG